MKDFVGDIERLTHENDDFRRVLFTGPNLQLVVMALGPGEEIGEEVHDGHDQFIRIESGEADLTLEGQVRRLGDGDATIIKAGTRHNLANVGSGALKLYTLYAPPEHPDGAVQHRRPDAGEVRRKG